MDLSSPRGKSINEGIPKSEFAVEYSKFDDAVDLVRTFGKNCFLAKIDVQHAFRIVPVHPDDWHKLCFQADGFYFVDTRLSFGSRSSPFIFNTFADFLRWYLAVIIGIAVIIHYLDDFLLVASDFTNCNLHVSKMLSACARLGVPINRNKLVGPSTVLTYLGILIDTENMQIRLPPEKLESLKNLLATWSSKVKCKKRELLSLIGKLSFACKVVKPGRMFLRRLIKLSTTVTSLDHYICIDEAAREDILWWVQFISEWNGVSIILDNPNNRRLRLFTDASNLGLGGYFRSNWFSLAWPISHANLHINIKELLAVMAATFTWAHLLKNKKVVVFTDNLDIVQIWLTGSSQNDSLMKLIRILFLFCARNNIALALRHIAGFKNTKADFLSRLQVDKFKAIHPSADETPSPVEPHLWTCLT